MVLARLLTIDDATQVDGPLNNGTAQLHMIKPRGASDYEYKYLFVDVKGQDRIYLENAEASGAGKKKQLRMFGVNWGWYIDCPVYWDFPSTFKSSVPKYGGALWLYIYVFLD